MEVTLTVPEMNLALQSAWLRIMVSTAKGLNAATTKPRPFLTRIKEEVVGAVAEVAVAKAVGGFFVPSVNTFHRVPDILHDVEVRATDDRNGRLIVRDNDSNDRRYLLVTTDGLNSTIVGWMTGGDAKQDHWRANPGGYRESWFVPQHALRPPEEVIQ